MIVDVPVRRRLTEAEADALVRLPAPSRDLGLIVDGPARLVDPHGATVALTIPYPGDTSTLRRAILDYPMTTTARTGGIRNASRVFGYVSRNPIFKRHACASCSGATEAPEAHAAICAAADLLWTTLADLLPEDAQRTQNVVSVLPDWRLGETPWSSGVVNRTPPLPYHRDNNNYPRAFGAMVVFRRHARGGLLHLPEWGVSLACRDATVAYFAGHGLVHGVSPIRLVRNDGYRFSAVYYPVRNMGRCLEPSEELRHAAVARTAAADEGLEGQRARGLA